MRDWLNLMEMATRAPDSLRDQKFYHGTSSSIAAKAIMKKGLQPPEAPARSSQLTPVEGMVYLTPDLAYALIYAAGGNYIGSSSYRIPYRGEKNKLEFERVLKTRDGSLQRYGYIFVVDGADLQNVQPDEDHVGDLYHYILCKREPNPAYCERYFVQAWEALKADPTFFSRFKYHMDCWATDAQKTKIEQGYYAYYAAAGKRAVKKMSDEMKAKLCEIGLHVAHQGAVIPTECYKFDKTKIGWMNKDGSNFFDFAVKL